MTNPSVIQEIKDRLDIVTVISRYVPLKKSGSSYKGLCPFHQEKTPSFHVFPHTGTWKCFGCGAGGDIFTFIEKRENLPFPDVLRMLAKEAGVPLEPVRPEVQSARQRLLSIHEHAVSYFQHQLLATSEGARARDYLAQREITQETIEQFQLGYARDGWEHLLQHLLSKGFSQDEIIQAGLAIPRESGGAYDRFRHRLIIPIRDAQGRVIAFGGRILGPGEPKYLNSPQTPIFDKSRVIFGLDMAKRAIRAKDQVVLVEGYMDVISAHQRGFKNVVAAMGTSITPQQIHILSRYSSNFVFALDADAAGARATWRGVMLVQEVLAEKGVLSPTPHGFQRENRLTADVRIAIMPQDQDPDDVLRQDPEQWRSLIENAIPVVDYIIQQTAAQYDLTTATGKSQFVSAVLPTLNKIGDAIQRRHYLGRVAALARVREQDVEEALSQYQRAQRRRTSSPSRTISPPSAPTQEPPPEPPATIISGASEEPPLWTDTPDIEPIGPGEASTSPAPSPSSSRLLTIGPEEHLLAMILLDFQQTLPWLDQELAELQMLPLYDEDFTNALNRAVFEALQDYLFDEIDVTFEAYLEQLDPYIQDHYHWLMAYAQQFLKEKPKYIKEHHLQRDVITGLLRLRLERIKTFLQELEISLAQDTNSENLQYLGQLITQRRELERAQLRYSQTAQWIKNQRSYAIFP